MVAILILLELTLQSLKQIFKHLKCLSRNPYFIGINSAIRLKILSHKISCGRNPYFIGINSAMKIEMNASEVWDLSQSLFYWN